MPTNDSAATAIAGKVIEIRGVVIDAVFPARCPPSTTRCGSRSPDQDRELVAEVQQHLGDDRVRAVAMDSTDGLARGMDVIDTGGADLGAGRQGDARPALQRARRADRREGRRRRSRSAGRSTATRRRSSDLSPKVEIFETGHQGHRPARPVRHGRQDRPVRRRRRRQDGPHPGADPQLAKEHGGLSVFAGVGERTREGNDLYLEMSRVRASSTRPRSSSAR